MKKLIAIVLCFCLFAVPVMGAEVDNPEEAEIRVAAVCDRDNVEVGDQFLVKIMIDGENNGYLTYSVAGSFDPETVELIAPVYKDDDFSIVWNVFSNEDGTFQFDAADIRNIQGSTDNLICSLLFKAKKAGKFSLKLGKAAGENVKLIVGRTKAVGSSYDYPLVAEGMEMDITEDTDSEDVVIIAEKENKTPYDDMFGYEWAEVAVGALATLGVLDGVAETSFEPGKNITRGEFAAMLVRSAKLTGEGGQFPDVAEDYPFAKEIATARKKGIALGDENGNFNPDAEVTRQDISAFVYRALNVLGKIHTADEEILEPFADSGEISDYAVPTMAAVVRAKLIKGDDEGLLNPKNNMTRAEAAVLLERVIVHIKLVR
ncbi:MAG: S-layer homology domain-containing protein [Clostridia bacterium]